MVDVQVDFTDRSRSKVGADHQLTIVYSSTQDPMPKLRKGYHFYKKRTGVYAKVKSYNW